MDQTNGLLVGVKILGPESKNRRRYLPEAISSARPLYEGLKVNIDHPDSPQLTRGLRDRFGKIINVREEDGCLRGDLKFNPKHRMADEVKWWAENEPDCLGLSHNAVGQGHDEDGVFVVEKILAVRSVDLVADPATTKGLYEAMGSMDDPLLSADAGDAEDAGYEAHVGHLVAAIMKDDALDKDAKRKKLLKALKLLDDETPQAEVEMEDEGEEEDAGDFEDDSEDGEDEKKEDSEEGCRESLGDLANDPRVRRLVEALDRYKASDALAARQARVRKLCEQAKLPDVLLTDVFMEQLVTAPDEASMKRLIEDRRRIASAGVKPRSSGPGNAVGMNLDQFGRALKGGKR